MAQQYKVEGTVVDQSGQPVVGAGVVVKGTTQGISTGVDGKFTLNVQPTDILSVTFLGYQSVEIPVANKTTIEITLQEDSQKLEDVVVVGFGTQKKENLTGAVGIAKGKDLALRPVTNATQSLQGMVPGLQITRTTGAMDKKSTVSIRGSYATIGEGSSGSPLILIDGMEGSLEALNPQDIESISVLKDAASSSIYGTRAPFGVILVTTRKGRSGDAVINYNNSFRFSSPINMPSMADSYHFAYYMNEGLANKGAGAQFQPEHLQRILDFQQGKITTTIPQGSDGKWADAYAAGNDNVDWYDALFKSSNFAQEHNLSVSGGSDKISYYLSGNYMDQDGMLKLGENSYQRYAATAKINAQVKPWFRAGYSMRFIREDFIRPSGYDEGSFFNDMARQAWPTLPLKDPNGHYYYAPSPALKLAEGGYDRNQTDNTYHQFTFVFEPVKGWKINAELGYHIENQNRRWATYQLYNHDIAGSTYPVDGTSGGHIHNENYKNNYLTLNLYTSYEFRVAEKHLFSVMAGFQMDDYKQDFFSAQRNGIIADGNDYIDSTTGLDYYGNKVDPSLAGYFNQWRTAGFFGRINYNYDNRYLAEINLRYDGSSRFRTDSRWLVCPSFSVGWNIAQEHFLRDVNNVDLLKIRFSYGKIGNQNTTSWYPTYPTFDIHTTTDGSGHGSWLQGGSKPIWTLSPDLISAGLTWEKVETYDVGFDFGFFNNRLTGSFDWYTRNTLDMVGPAQELPGVLGKEVPKSNNTDLQTRGWELALHWSDQLQCGLGYSVGVTLTDYKSKITRYPNETNSLDTHYKGQTLGEIWGYETIGIAKTQQEMDAHLASLPNGGQSAVGNNWAAGDIMYRDLNDDGKISEGARTLGDRGDLKVIGNSTPRYQFGIDLGLTYKGLDFRAYFQGVAKRDLDLQQSMYFWGASKMGQWWSACLDEHLDFFTDGTTPYGQAFGANTDAYYPRPVYDTDKNQKTQTRYLQNAAYIRLKNLTVGYTLPQSLTKKWALQRVRIYFSGENLWTGTKLSKLFDPETGFAATSSDDSSVKAVVRGASYPLSRTFSFGIDLSF